MRTKGIREQSVRNVRHKKELSVVWRKCQGTRWDGRCYWNGKPEEQNRENGAKPDLETVWIKRLCYGVNVTVLFAMLTFNPPAVRCATVLLRLSKNLTLQNFHCAIRVEVNPHLRLHSHFKIQKTNKDVGPTKRADSTF